MDAGLDGVGLGGSRDPRPKTGDRIGIGEQTHLAAPVPMRFFLPFQHNPFIHRCIAPFPLSRYYNYWLRLKWQTGSGAIGSIGVQPCTLRHARCPASGPFYPSVDSLWVSRA